MLTHGCIKSGQTTESRMDDSSSSGIEVLGIRHLRLHSQINIKVQIAIILLSLQISLFFLGTVRQA